MGVLLERGVTLDLPVKATHLPAVPEATSLNPTLHPRYPYQICDGFGIDTRCISIHDGWEEEKWKNTG